MTQLLMTSRRIAGVGAVLSLAALTAAAQPAAKRVDDDPGLTFKAGTKEVVLHTAILDRSGHFVTDLPQSAFKVYEEEVLQELRYFRREDVPVSLGILVDNSGSMRDKRRQVNTAAVDFVKASNPKDEVFIVNFNDEGFLDSPFTSDVLRLQDALQRIDSRGGTALYDAVGMSLDYLSEKAKWDKQVLLIVTDGEDNASVLDLERLVRRLQEGDTVIYAVGLLSEEDRRSAKRATRAVQNITRSTGGTAHFPKSVGEVHAIAQKVAEDIRSQYILAYTPASSSATSRFRRVKVVLSGKSAKKLQVRHRPGYYY